MWPFFFWNSVPLCSTSGEIFPNLHILFTYTFQLCFSTFSVKKRWYTRYVWPINWIISLISSIEQTDRKVALLLYIYNVIKIGIRLGKNFLISQSSLRSILFCLSLCKSGFPQLLVDEERRLPRLSSSSLLASFQGQLPVQ